MEKNQKTTLLRDEIDSISGKTIAIIEDEPDISELVSLNLTKAGYTTKEFGSAEKFFKYLNNDNPDLILLDLMLPDADGLEICKYIKREPKFSSTPIIILTAKGDETDKILGLELGADDYITKPFSTRELVARVKAVLRREIKSTQEKIITAGKILKVDLQKYEVLVNEEKVELTSTEFKILNLLLERRGWVYSRSQILARLDTQDKGVLDRTVDVHIKNLRDKLKDAGKFIKNIRGVGYKFES